MGSLGLFHVSKHVCVWDHHLLAAKTLSCGAESLRPDSADVVGHGVRGDAGEGLSGPQPWEMLALSDV